VRVLDTIERQLLEWARTELPSEPFGSQACRALIASELEASRATMTTYGVWCYYPWRSTVTHLLPKGHFVTVRTNRNRDKIKRDEQASMAQKRIGVAGLSVGHVAALVLAQERLCDELRIADFDQLDLSNINRLRTSVLNVGETKARLTAREIAEIDPYITVRVFPEGITENNLEGFLLEGGPLDLVVEECDSLPMKLRIRERAREHGIPVVMDTNDRGLVDIERFDLERARPLLHGLLGAHTAATVAGLDPAERLALFYDFFGGESEVSGAFRDSIRKIGRELVSYPQLASDVHLGGALVGHVVREIFLGRLTRSGRFAIDLHQLIDDGAAKLADAGGRPASRR
jgi:molybdopterin/thiamine biosynthesis adenylyltransferase